MLLRSQFLQKVDLVAHSPLVRAKDTCFGALDLSNHPHVKVVELDSLREIFPWERLLFLKGRRQRPLRRRIRDLCHWLASQDARTVVLVGHSEYFMVLLDQKEKFRNCDVWKAKFQNDQWSNLKLVHRLGSSTKDLW
mmetsp:Transcript_29361/g.67972  ORF Transcript_29361/g.67972 Transcript_29361/m.67972 type:complete len:137 (+) Transcript_29361:68-478(+)